MSGYIKEIKIGNDIYNLGSQDSGTKWYVDDLVLDESPVIKLVGSSITSNFKDYYPDIKEGDMHLDTKNGYVYECTFVGEDSCRFTYVGVLMGSNATKWYVDNRIITNNVFSGNVTSNFRDYYPDIKVGDMHLSTANGYICECTQLNSGSVCTFVYRGNIKGPKWYVDKSMSNQNNVTISVDSYDGVKEGDMHICTENGNIHECIGVTSSLVTFEYKGSLLTTDKFVTTNTTQTITSAKTFNEYCIFQKGAGMSSDIRFKKNVKPINNVLEDVVKVNLIEYTWDKPNEPVIDSIGVSAQQLEEIGGELVKTVHITDDEDKTRSVDYSKLSVITLKAVQELYEIVQKQQNEIDNLKSKMS